MCSVVTIPAAILSHTQIEVLTENMMKTTKNKIHDYQSFYGYADLIGESVIESIDGYSE